MLNFPSNPANGQEYTNDSRTWQWSSTTQAWLLKPVSTAESILAANSATAAEAARVAAEAARDIAVTAAEGVEDVADDVAAAEAAKTAAETAATAAAASATAASTSEDAAEASATTASGAATTATTKAGEAAASAVAALGGQTGAETAQDAAETAASAAAASAVAADASADAAAASAASMTSATDIGLGGEVLAKGLFDLNTADIGTFIRVSGLQDQGTPLNWPFVGPFGTSPQELLVQTFGSGLAGNGQVAQIAISGTDGGDARTFIRNRYDSGWNPWRELVFQDSVYPAQSQLKLNAQVGTAYTLVDTDAGKRVDMSNAAANVLTVPPNADVAIPVDTVIFVSQGGAGATSVAAGAGVTLNNATGLNVGGQHKMLSLIKTAANVWTVLGGAA